MLSIAGVIGRDFELDVLSSASETAEDGLLDVLDAAVDATLVDNVAGQRYSFSGPTGNCQTGHPGFGDTLLAAARMAQRVGDTRTLVAATLANSRGFASAAYLVDGDRVATIDAALVAVGDADSTARARLLSLLALEHLYDDDHQARRRIADEALAMARRLGEPATLLRRPVTITDRDTVAERLADTAEAEALAESLGDPIGRFWSAAGRMTPAIISADLAEFTRCVEKQTALADRIGQPTLRWFSTIYQAWPCCSQVTLRAPKRWPTAASKSEPKPASPTPHPGTTG